MKNLSFTAFAAALALSSCAPPGCYYPTGDFTHYICPAQIAAEKAQERAIAGEQRQQELIKKLGGVKNYRAYEANLAEQQRERTMQVIYNECMGHEPVPMSSYQDEWEQAHCRKFADWITSGSPQ